MHVDGFRFDLAPALGARDRQLRCVGGVLRRRPPGSGPVAGEADRRALGSRRSRLSRSAASRAAGRSGTPATATACAATGAAIAAVLAELATRSPAAAISIRASGRPPTASINFVTCHDGFTLRDLVSFTQKHNEANGEYNHDGESNNISTNGGVEGSPTDRGHRGWRDCALVRNFLATLFVSQGVPMICAGDEMGRTQHGNNNAYCQDNEVSWVNWTLTPAERAAARVHAIADRRSGMRTRCCAGGATSTATATTATRTWSGTTRAAARCRRRRGARTPRSSACGSRRPSSTSGPA